jgi:hypothetical protein
MDKFTDEDVLTAFRQLPGQAKLDEANNIFRQEATFRETKECNDRDTRIAFNQMILDTEPVRRALLEREVVALEKLVAHFCK